MIEIPSINYNINGCNLNLQICAVRSYSETNLLGNSTQKQTFRVGIGFLNSVCCNLNLSTDGTKFDIKVTNTADLYRYCMELFSRYNHKKHIEELKRLNDTIVDVKTFAQFLGKCRMYQALPQSVKYLSLFLTKLRLMPQFETTIPTKILEVWESYYSLAVIQLAD